MKQINQYITEKIKLSKDRFHRETLTPKSKEALLDMILDEMRNYGVNCDLNHIDVSKITDMSELFAITEEGDTEMDASWFNGDISKWDVRNVRNMERMFARSDFNGDISNWETYEVENMESMFDGSTFNNDISNWNVKKVRNMAGMFAICQFNQPIGNWDVSNVRDMSEMFYGNMVFNQNIDSWNINSSLKTADMFADSLIEEKNKYPKWYTK